MTYARIRGESTVYELVNVTLLGDVVLRDVDDKVTLFEPHSRRVLEVKCSCGEWVDYVRRAGERAYAGHAECLGETAAASFPPSAEPPVESRLI